MCSIAVKKFTFLGKFGIGLSEIHGGLAIFKYTHIQC
jgi:hypothetical protein